MRAKSSKWLPTILGEHIEITSGFAFKSNQFADNGSIPIARIRDVKRGFSKTYYTGNYDKKYLIQNGDLLVGMDGEFNAALWVGEQALLNQRVCLVKSLETLDFDFLRFLLPIELKKIEARTPFVTVKHISTEQIRSIEFFLPPLEEQRRIAAILNKADVVRRKRQQAIALTEELLRSAFLEMFGDPITNPKGWKIGTILDVVANLKTDIRCGPFGTQLKSHEIVSAGIPLIGIDNVKGGRFQALTKKHITLSKAKELAAFDVQSGDVLVTRMGTIGHACVVPQEIGEARISFHLFRVRPDSSKCLPGFLSSTITWSGTFLSQLQQLAHGAIMAGLKTADLKEVRFLLPPINLQKQYLEIVVKTEGLLEKQRKQITSDKHLFNSLLQKAFRGEL